MPISTMKIQNVPPVIISVHGCGCGSDRWAIARPPAERKALNLVLDVLAQLLEDAFDVLGRAVIGERP